MAEEPANSRQGLATQPAPSLRSNLPRIESKPNFGIGAIVGNREQRGAMASVVRDDPFSPEAFSTYSTAPAWMQRCYAGRRDFLMRFCTTLLAATLRSFFVAILRQDV